MSFIADKQTQNDLNLLSKFKPDSIYSFYNCVHTNGGQKLLEELFRNPLTDAGQINQRSRLFKHFQGLKLIFPFNAEDVLTMESYLQTQDTGNILFNGFSTVKSHLLGAILNDENYGALLGQLNCTIKNIAALKKFLNKIKPTTDGRFNEQLEKANRILTHPGLKKLIQDHNESSKKSVFQIVAFNHQLRYQLHQDLVMLLHFIYFLDLYINVSNLAAAKSFCYANALEERHNTITAKGLYHPLIKNAVANDIEISRERNVVFLTGANMAGKSTFMKTIGIAIYLAHMGFPVAATSLEFSVKEGIYSSINVPDDINMGYSHFYAEVKRVKTVAEDVSEAKSLMVIFDELFKGTNVKDAYDATLAVTTAFADYRHSLFIISTHIVEVGEALNNHNSLQFVYLPTTMSGNIPQYTYQLKQGISSDRQGMMIIEQEGIVDMIRSCATAKTL